MNAAAELRKCQGMSTEFALAVLTKHALAAGIKSAEEQVPVSKGIERFLEAFWQMIGQDPAELFNGETVESIVERARHAIRNPAGRFHPAPPARTPRTGIHPGGGENDLELELTGAPLPWINHGTPIGPLRNRNGAS